MENRNIDLEFNNDRKPVTNQVIVKPTDDELIIPGEFLGIDVHHTSFTVRFQMVVVGFNPPEMYQVQTRTYPIKELRRFFRVNGNIETKLPVCSRPFLDEIEQVRI